MINLKFYTLGIFICVVVQANFSELKRSGQNAFLDAILKDRSKKLIRFKRERLTSVCPVACTCKARGNENKFVRCVGTGKTRLPDTIPADATLLDFAYNNIREVEVLPLEELSFIKYIDFSFNKIKDIHNKAFKDQYRLEWLDLSNNPLLNLTVHDLSEARRSLTVLNISNTGMSFIPRLSGDEISISKLETLVAANNNFTEIPHGGIPSTVRHLDLSCLRMRELSGVPFRTLYALNVLIIKGCGLNGGIESVQDGAFEKAKVLRKIDFSGNALRAIPRGLPESLFYLDLSGNRITRLKNGKCANEDAIRNHFRVIANADAAEPGGNVVGSDVSHLVNLVELNLANNFITTLCSDDFMLMQQLQVLNLTNSKIKTFHPETFLYAQSLRVLDLSNNHITKFHISELPDLEELYAERNFISEVEGLTKAKLPSLKEADFSFNRYNCDCNLRDFLRFLGSAYNEEVRFRYLSATSKRYACFKPPNLRDRSLMSLDIVTDATCGMPPSSISWAAIGAPISLVLLFILVLSILMIQRRRSGKSICCTSCCSSKDDSQRKVVSTYAKYDGESDIEIQNHDINDLAILSHDLNQKWVMNTFVPKLHGFKDGGGQEVEEKVAPTSQVPIQNRPLKIEVFTIGKTIRIDTLHRCIDVNRKVAIVVTHEFLQEESCLYILKVIQERMLADPKEAVLCIIMDPISWKKMPEPLQKLVSEKTFLQFPIKDRERQEFYFWDNLNSLVFASKAKSQRPWKTDDKEEGFAIRYPQRYDEEIDLNEGDETIRSSRRASSRHSDSNKQKVSTARAARLQRLGITSDGNVVEHALHELDEARNLHQNVYLPRSRKNSSASRVAHNVISKPSMNDQASVPALSRTLSAKGSLNPDWSHHHKGDDAVQRDIDDLYTTRKDLCKFESNCRSGGRVHSLFPPHCEDVDSVYSDDGEIPLPGHDIRPPERHRSSSPPKRKLKESRSQKSRSIPSSRDTIEVLENLHGTEMNKTTPGEVSIPQEEAVEFENKQTETENKKPKQKNKQTLKRLKSIFSNQQ